MATTPQQRQGMIPPMEAGGPPPPPGTDMTGICFRDQLWLNSFPLDRNFVFDYFALSPFYDFSCNNEQLRLRSIHPLDSSHLSKMTGIEFMLTECTEPHLFVFKKQRRDGPEKVTPMLTYYILDGSIYQAPQLASVFASRMVRALYYISKSFDMASSKLEKIGYDTESDATKPESKSEAEDIDIKELKRVDHILVGFQRKLHFRLLLDSHPNLAVTTTVLHLLILRSMMGGYISMDTRNCLLARTPQHSTMLSSLVAIVATSSSSTTLSRRCNASFSR